MPNQQADRYAGVVGGSAGVHLSGSAGTGVQPFGRRSIQDGVQGHASESGGPPLRGPATRPPAPPSKHRCEDVSPHVPRMTPSLTFPPPYSSPSPAPSVSYVIPGGARGGGCRPPCTFPAAGFDKIYTKTKVERCAPQALSD